MAGTATARAGSGKASKATPKAPVKKKRAKRQRVNPAPEVQTSLFVSVVAENPDITSEGYAIRFALPLDEVMRLRHFIHEYLRDFDEKAATLRMGYPMDSAASTSKMFLFHPYVQLRVIEVLKCIEPDKIVSAGQIIAGLLKEATAPDIPFSSNANTRIAAWKLLAQIQGLLNPKAKDPAKLGPAGGIMFVPIAATPEEWAESARASQKALVDSAIEAEIVS